jgi:hypothetical protein
MAKSIKRRATRAAHKAEKMVHELGTKARRALRRRKVRRIAHRTGQVLKKAGTVAAAAAVTAGTAAVVSEVVGPRKH